MFAVNRSHGSNLSRSKAGHTHLNPMKMRSAARFDPRIKHHNMASRERKKNYPGNQQRADSPTLTSSEAEI